MKVMSLSLCEAFQGSAEYTLEWSVSFGYEAQGLEGAPCLVIHVTGQFALRWTQSGRLLKTECTMLHASNTLFLLLLGLPRPSKTSAAPAGREFTPADTARVFSDVLGVKLTVEDALLVGPLATTQGAAL